MIQVRFRLGEEFYDMGPLHGSYREAVQWLLSVAGTLDGVQFYLMNVEHGNQIYLYPDDVEMLRERTMKDAYGLDWKSYGF